MSFGKAFRRSHEVNDSSRMNKVTNDRHKPLDLTKQNSKSEKQYSKSENFDFHKSDTSDTFKLDRKTKKSTLDFIKPQEPYSFSSDKKTDRSDKSYISDF